MFGVAVEQVSTDVREKFDDSRSNRSRDVRVSHFVMNDNDAGLRRSSHKGKTPYGVLPNNNNNA